MWSTTGAAAAKAKRKAVDNQLMMEGVVSKKVAAVLATGEKVIHCFNVNCVLRYVEHWKSTYVPTDDDVQQDQLHQSEPPSLVEFVSNHWPLFCVRLHGCCPPTTLASFVNLILIFCIDAERIEVPLVLGGHDCHWFGIKRAKKGFFARPSSTIV